jgi:hypothetical protein
VAFETAWLLEQSGETVDQLVLLCPGNPLVRQEHAERHGRQASFANPAYLAILYSVFAGAVHGPAVDTLLATVRDEQAFIDYVVETVPGLHESLIRRIVRIVAQTYAFEYRFEELAHRHLRVPVTIVKATGDDYSFLETAGGYSAAPPRLVQLNEDHYSVLRPQGVGELVRAIRDLT